MVCSEGRFGEANETLNEKTSNLHYAIYTRGIMPNSQSQWRLVKEKLGDAARILFNHLHALRVVSCGHFLGSNNN